MIDETIVLDRLIERHAKTQVWHRFAAILPLTFLTLIAMRLPNSGTLYTLIAIQSFILIAYTLVALSLNYTVARNRAFLSTLRIWAAFEFLCGFFWGAIAWPVAHRLGTDFASTLVVLTVIVTISISVLVVADIKTVAIARMVGFTLAFAPIMFLDLAHLGSLPLIAALTLGPCVMWLAFLQGGLTREALSAQMQNELMAKNLREALHVAEYLSQHDSLTGLPNRRAFESVVGEIRTSPTHPVALILLDLDHFKKVNDRFGHAVGDLVLKATAKLIARFDRPSSLHNDAVTTFARWGGEEFIIAVSPCSVATAAAIAETLRERLAGHRDDHWPEALCIQGSFGIALQQPHESIHAAIGRADNAMYQAKVAGRNCVVIAGNTPSLTELSPIDR